MAQGITLAKAIEVFSRELGCTDSRDTLIDEIMASIEFMLLNGGGDILHEWEVVVRDGKFTFPRNLETPIKYKFSRLPNAGFGTVHSAYYTYSSNAVKRCCGYNDFDDQRIEVKANRVATQFEPPACGLQSIVATTRNDKDVGRKIMVSGQMNGMDIAPLHNNYKTAGELLTIYKEDSNSKKYSSFPFEKITAVTKDETCDYIMLSGKGRSGKWYFLSHYHPDEITPQYVQGHLMSCPGWCCDSIICILGRVSPNMRYIRNEDVLPITSFEMLNLLAKRKRYDASGDFDQVAVMEVRIRDLIKKQVAYQQEANRQLSYTLASSGASLTSL